jgi:hypothetical protein
MPGVVAGHLISKYDNLKDTSCQEANRGSEAILDEQPSNSRFGTRRATHRSRTARFEGSTNHRHPVRDLGQRKIGVLRPIKL